MKRLNHIQSAFFALPIICILSALAEAADAPCANLTAPPPTVGCYCSFTSFSELVDLNSTLSKIPGIGIDSDKISENATDVCFISALARIRGIEKSVSLPMAYYFQNKWTLTLSESRVEEVCQDGEGITEQQFQRRVKMNR